MMRILVDAKFLIALTCLGLAGCASFQAERRAVESVDARALDRARVIFVGEQHDADAHHRFQLALIQKLHEQGRQLAVGLEMVDVTKQTELDGYLAGRIGWREFSKMTGFAGWESHSRWYRKILEWCRHHDVPAYALNAPRSVTRKLASGQPLTGNERNLVPDWPEPPGGFPAFQQLFPHHGGKIDLRRYYSAQRAWDQVMASSVLDVLSNSDATLVVLLGAAHANTKHAVPWYVRRESDTAQLVLLPQ